MQRKPTAQPSEMEQWFASGRDPVARRPLEPPVMPPDWLRFAMRFCRDGEDGLARYLRVVPASHLREVFAEGAGTAGPTSLGVECVCGVTVRLPDREFVQCAGDCGRWFVADLGTVWAARLPVEQPDEAVA